MSQCTLPGPVYRAFRTLIVVENGTLLDQIDAFYDDLLGFGLRERFLPNYFCMHGIIANNTQWPQCTM